MKSILVVLLLSVECCFGQWKPLAQVAGAQRSRADVGVSWRHMNASPAMRYDESTGDERKSVAKAALYSLLLPGMGEMYAGDYGSGKYFTIAEGALWITLGSVHWYASWLQNDARSFAIQNAHISVARGDDQYFIDVGNFVSTATYDEQAGRDRQYFKIYGPTSPYRWQWDSPEVREQYRLLRVSSDEMFNNTRFIAAAIAVNHVISAINAARLAISHNHGMGGVGLIDLHADVLGGITRPDGIMVTLTKHF